MDKKYQDLAWTSLPKETREIIRYYWEAEFESELAECAVNCVLGNLFGFHNLDSETEPEEMVFARRFEVLWRYEEYTSGLQVENLAPELRGYNRGAQTVLRLLFGDKCFPDPPEQKPTPKFKVGDSVLHTPTQIVYDVVGYNEQEGRYKLSRMSGVATMFAPESDLAPYTEPEPKQTETKEDPNECKTLFYTLWELEKASRNVRDALMAFKNAEQ